MRKNRLTRFIGTGVAAIAIGAIAPSAASAACADADLRPTRSTHPDWIVAMFQDMRTAERAANAVVCLTNEYRVSRLGEPERLPVHSALATAGRRQASYMAMRNDFTHSRPAPDWQRARDAGYPVGYDSVGENISWGPGSDSTPRRVVTRWINSPGHHANIVNRSYEHIGVGVALSAPTTYSGQAATYAQLFAWPS